LRASKISEIRAGVGSPEPKTVTTYHGGPTVAFQLRDDQQVTLSVEALDAEGNPAGVAITWADSGGLDADGNAVIELTDNGDGTATVVASPTTGGLGISTVTATATDNSDGDVHTATFDVEVVAGDAVTFNVMAGAPEPKA
jgi:hypothetical protein